jgi:hypothetical protein
MLRYLHTLSAALFYILAGLFFLMLILARNNVLSVANTLLNITDLPLLLAGLLFGGLSLYRSIRKDGDLSHGLLAGIAIPLVILFVLLMIANFMPAS